MVNPLNAYASGNLFATGDQGSGASAVKSLFDASTAQPAQNDPYGLLAGAQSQANGLALQSQVEQGLRGPDGGLGRLNVMLGKLDEFIKQGQGDLTADERADLQQKIDNLLEDFAAIAGNPQLTDPALVEGSGLLGLGGVDAPISVASASEATVASATLNQTTSALADVASQYGQSSELQRAQGAVFQALTGVAGLGGYGETGAVNQNDARSLLMGASALGLLV